MQYEARLRTPVCFRAQGPEVPVNLSWWLKCRTVAVVTEVELYDLISNGCRLGVAQCPCQNHYTYVGICQWSGFLKRTSDNLNQSPCLSDVLVISMYE